MDNLRVLLGIRRMDSVPSARIRELCSVAKGIDERLMKVFSSGFAMWRGWRRTGESLQEMLLVVVQWVFLGRNGLIP